MAPRRYHTGMPLALRPLAPEHLEIARALLATACRFDAAARVAGEKLFGPAAGYAAGAVQALGAWQGEILAGVAAVCGPWIRILAVEPAHRGQGVGTALLDAAERAVAAAGSRAVRLLDQPGNYLAPGIDLRNRDTITWLERRGYSRCGERVNLLVPVGARQDPRASAEPAGALAAGVGYELRRARPDDARALTAEIAASFSAGWAFEVGRALACEPPAVHVALAPGSGALAAFAVHDGNNRGLGWFGPAGTLPAHRGRGLGAALLRACLTDIAAAGHEVCEVAWIGPREFYARVAGIAGERRFVVMRKELS